MNQVIESCADSVLSGTQLNRRQGLALAAAAKEDFEDMLYWADRIRRHFFGDSVRLCSIVPGRLGGCGQDCAFCAQSLHYNTSVDKTPRLLSDEKILSAAAEARSSGVSSFGIVYSGRSPAPAEFEHLLGLVEQIRRNIGIPVCAALGILEEAQMRQLASAGAVRYNHNLETSRRYFPNIVKTHHYQERVKTIQAALKAGLKVCGGGIFGLGETDEDRVELALELRTLGVDTVPMNFLHPIPGTPLGSSPPLPPKEILRIIALYRFLLPEADLKVAGGRVFNLRDMQSWIFRAGCSSIISGNYLATAGRSVPEDKQMLADLGLRIAD
jgi:biotin synthase